MKLLVIAVATVAIVGTSAHAQNTRVLEPEARPGQPTAGVPQATDRGTNTGQAPIAVPNPPTMVAPSTSSTFRFKPHLDGSDDALSKFWKI
jgi:hypothetical protein